MKVTKKSNVSGNINTMELPVTQAELDRYAEGKERLQNVFPHISADQREFIKTGITPEEWAEIFGDEE